MCWCVCNNIARACVDVCVLIFVQGSSDDGGVDVDSAVVRSADVGSAVVRSADVGSAVVRSADVESTTFAPMPVAEVRSFCARALMCLY